MGQGTLTIYNASAGSGKTYTLTGIYLSEIFKSRYNYRKILAVTFTNKATAEMKMRILDHLYKLSTGEDSDYLGPLVRSTGKTPGKLSQEASEILNTILHDYSRFSISTIDSFFQKVLRAFTREAGLHSGFSVELDTTTILSEAVDEMIESASGNPQLKRWLITYAISNIDEERSWNLKDGIMRLAGELFREKFKILSDQERSRLEDKDFLFGYIRKLRSIIAYFEGKLLEYGKMAIEIYSAFDLTDDLFFQKGKGIPKFIKELNSGIPKEPSSAARQILSDPPRWSTGPESKQLQNAIENGLSYALQSAISYYDDNKNSYFTAVVVLKNIYALGILTDVLRHTHTITESENKFLLADAGEVLHLITKEDQSPFIYEKIGNRYENYMIDEFQDTSAMQWNNFSPLIDNSMAEGNDNLVVGDVKQSIYRWRNSDWTILGKFLHSRVDNKRVISKALTTNWRSRTNIIKFNNSLFSILPQQFDDLLSDLPAQFSFRDLYAEAIQEDPHDNKGGYVRFEFIENDEKGAAEEEILRKLPGIIESIEDKGYKAGDIGILVRDGREGCMVLNRLAGYNSSRTSTRGEPYNFNAVSNDSLLLSNSPAIVFIIAALSVLNDPRDFLNRAVMLRFYLMSVENQEAETVSLKSETIIETSRSFFPDGYEAMLERIRQLPLFEAAEALISFFGLGEYKRNVPFLNTFQDHVVNFTSSGTADFSSFLVWWEQTGTRQSVVLPENQDAIRILTIHKSKGLEFKAVIVPFITWQLDHISTKQPFLWVTPDVQPFSDLGVVPVKYSKDLLNTIFNENYTSEKFSVYLDNLNLLYVALTRAREILYGFSIDNSRSNGTIGGLLKSALCAPASEGSQLSLHSYYNTEMHVFEYGEMPGNISITKSAKSLITSGYKVNQKVESLNLKLHGENYFSSDSEKREKINYGKLMHELFERITYKSDIPSAVRNLVLEGKISEDDAARITERISGLIEQPEVAGWFSADNKVMNEAGILLSEGITRRPDRVIFRDGKTVIVDFKFGSENDHYIRQINRYRDLLIQMGYNNITACIWYVDQNKIVYA